MTILIDWLPSMFARHPAIARELEASRSRQESLARAKPHEETAIQLEKIDPALRGLVEAIVQSLAEGKLVQAKLNALGLVDACKARP